MVAVLKLWSPDTRDTVFSAQMSPEEGRLKLFHFISLWFCPGRQHNYAAIVLGDIIQILCKSASTNQSHGGASDWLENFLARWDPIRLRAHPFPWIFSSVYRGPASTRAPKWYNIIECTHTHTSISPQVRIWSGLILFCGASWGSSLK